MTAQTTEIPATERLVALLDHLGIGAAHFATQMPGDIAGLAAAHPHRMAGIVLCVPTRLDAAPFAGVADRLLMIAGERGLTGATVERAAARLPGAKRLVLADYDAPGWADVVADRGDEIVREMTGFLGRFPADSARRGGQGSVAEVTYAIRGNGPALVLLPFFLAPSQWDPAIDDLARHFTVVRVGGRHVGGVAALEDRARSPTYRSLFRTLIDIMDPQPGEAILDVGCGAGSLDRLLAQRLGADNPITASDTNAFLLREAAALATEDGLDGRIRFAEGNAESLPFPDASFGCAFSVTVLEECDADRAIAEMKRVTRPGGRIGIVVRSIDMPQWWSFAVPEPLRARAETPPQSVGATGVADASLYRRMADAGLTDLVCFPSLVTFDRPGSPIWRYREDHVLSQLSPDETREWNRARQSAPAGGLFMAHPLHCAVATRP